MSAQCWCFACAGRIVSRKTWINHGRKDKPDDPLPEQEQVQLLSMDQDEIESSPAFPSSDTEMSSDEECAVNALGLGQEAQNDCSQGAGKAQLTAPEVTLFLLDWMCSHKVTDAATENLWNLVNMILPDQVDIPTFAEVKNILRKNEMKYVKRYDICPNDCIVYFDSKNLVKPYKHSHRLKCPKCSTPRYVVDPSDGRTRPAKVFFFFPIAPYIRSLFARPDLVPYLYHDSDRGTTPGHVKHSRGFKKKMWDDSYMASDHRNLGLIGTTDGVPFFADQKRGIT